MVGARSPPALRAQGSPCPSRYRLVSVAPLLSVLLSSFGRVGFIAPVGGAPSSFGRCARLFHLFIGSTIGGATLSPCALLGRFCPRWGLVAWLCANRGAPPRLPFLSAPAPVGCGCCHSPPRWGRAVVAAVAATLFFRLPLCVCVSWAGLFPPSRSLRGLPAPPPPRMLAT